MCCPTIIDHLNIALILDKANTTQFFNPKQRPPPVTLGNFFRLYMHTQLSTVMNRISEHENKLRLTW